MSLLSKETKALQKKFQDSYLKDIKALVGKCFIDSTLEAPPDDAGDDCAGVELKQFLMITGLEDGELVGTAVTFNGGKLESLEANTFVEFLSDAPMQCSVKEFIAALDRAQREFKDNVDELKLTEMESVKSEEKK